MVYMFHQVKIINSLPSSIDSENKEVEKDGPIHEKQYRHLGQLTIDVEEYTVMFNGKSIVLPKKEFELLYLLSSNPNKVFRREEILDKIWGGSDRPKDSRSLDVHIRMIRKKLEEKFITTFRGVGYRLYKET